MQTLLLCAIEIVSVQCSVHQSCKRCLTIFDDGDYAKSDKAAYERVHKQLTVGAKI